MHRQNALQNDQSVLEKTKSVRVGERNKLCIDQERKTNNDTKSYQKT